MNEYVAEIAKLRDELGQAQEYVRYWKGMLCVDETRLNRLKIEFGFSPSEAVILSALSVGNALSKEVLFELVPHKSGGEDVLVVPVHIHRIRKKIAPNKINTVWGDGFNIDKQFAARVRAIMDGANG